MEESISEDEVDPQVYSGTPSSIPLLGEPEILAKAGSPLLLAGASPLNCTAWRLAQLRLLVTLPQIFRPLCIIFAHFG